MILIRERNFSSRSVNFFGVFSFENFNGKIYIAFSKILISKVQRCKVVVSSWFLFCMICFDVLSG